MKYRIVKDGDMYTCEYKKGFLDPWVPFSTKDHLSHVIDRIKEEKLKHDGDGVVYAE